jgi:ribosomal protein S27AE
MSCHDPHNPLLPHAPEDCSACHRQIASQKMVSHHTSLPCTTCHVTPPEHAISPRLVPAEKPTTKATCGQCHDEDSDSPREVPRIDLATHGDRYLCWDCHYPHFPEANQ